MDYRNYSSGNNPTKRRQIVQRKVINFDRSYSGEAETHYIHCGWDDCEKHGYECYKVRIHTEREGYQERIVNFVFCSERHRQYFIQSGQQAASGMHPDYMHGMLPKGMRNSL